MCCEGRGWFTNSVRTGQAPPFHRPWSFTKCSFFYEQLGCRSGKFIVKTQVWVSGPAANRNNLRLLLNGSIEFHIRLLPVNSSEWTPRLTAIFPKKYKLYCWEMTDERHSTLFIATWTQFTLPHLNYIKSFVISFHALVGLTSGLCSLGFQIKRLWISQLTPYPAYFACLIVVYLIPLIK